MVTAGGQKACRDTIAIDAHVKSEQDKAADDGRLCWALSASDAD